MKLSIIITHYKEPWEICRPLFDSIEMQLGVDFENDIELIIVNDSMDDNDHLNGDKLENYPFKNVKFVYTGHVGVSEARNAGLSIAEGEYVMFCDIDDRFISAYALHTMMKQFPTKYYIIKTPFVEDQVIDGELKLIRHEGDVSFVHGKMFRKEFLDENNIRFKKELTIHEDGYFNVIANILAKGKIHETSPALYLWKYNENSVVRKDRDLYIYKTYGNLMDCRIAICESLWEREYVTEYFQAVTKTVIDSYFDFQKHDALKPENKELIASAEKEFARFYEKFREDYNQVGVNDIALMMHACRVTAFMNGLKVEQETISEFLTRIVKTYLT